MKLEKHAAKKSKTHTVYRNKDGVRVPGVTTITGVMDKPALVPWANKLGLRGIEVRKYVDELAAVGTLAHAMIVSHLEGTELDVSDASPNQIDLAETATLKFWDWQKESEFRAEFCERQLVSEQYQYGGTCDLFGMVKDGRLALIDLKTCNAIYNDHWTQVAGYCIALEESGWHVDTAMIVRVGRIDTEGFEAKECSCLDLHKERFLLCRKLYEINKKIKRG